jgi:quercetin dioxygenase-like cupin family protein
VTKRGVEDQILTPPSARRLEVFETILEPGADSGDDYYEHPGDEEFIVVLEGALQVWLNGCPYELARGDSITFPCLQPHRWANLSDGVTRVFWVITPAGYS